MIIGIGTDIVNIKRIEKVLSRFGEKFEKRIYTQSERETADTIRNPQKRTAYYAKRFAAKEAYAKALGTGIGSGIKFQDISVEKEASGRPTLNIKNQSHKTHLSLSDDGHLAQAFVVIES